MVYRLTAAYPNEERFGLVSQMRRAAVSIPSNIAEGAARDSDNEFRNFLSIARSSLSELDTQFDLSYDLGFVPRTVTIGSRRATLAGRPDALRSAQSQEACCGESGLTLS